MSAPEVSVVMSCYNARRWLAAAIGSILEQSYRNLELIAVDDGSTDGTVEVLKSISEQDGRVIFHTKSNTGPAESRNIGIARAKGAWIAVLDADDMAAPDRLARQLEFVRRNPNTVLLGTGFSELDENNRVLATHSYPSQHGQLLHRLTRLGGFPPHSSAFFRRDVVVRLGGYRTTLRQAEDVDLYLRLSTAGRLACLAAPLVSIRKHAGQTSHEEGGKRQLVNGVGVIASYFLRQAGHTDPLESRASEFFRFVESKLDESRLVEARQQWAEARAVFLLEDRRSARLRRAVVKLLRSGYASQLVATKLFGSDLPHAIAKEWKHRDIVARRLSRDVMSAGVPPNVRNPPR